MVNEASAFALISHLRSATFTTGEEDQLLRQLLVEHTRMAQRTPALERAVLVCPSCGGILKCPFCGHDPGGKA